MQAISAKINFISKTVRIEWEGGKITVFDIPKEELPTDFTGKVLAIMRCTEDVPFF